MVVGTCKHQKQNIYIPQATIQELLRQNEIGKMIISQYILNMKIQLFIVTILFSLLAFGPLSN